MFGFGAVLFGLGGVLFGPGDVLLGFGGILFEPCGVLFGPRGVAVGVFCLWTGLNSLLLGFSCVLFGGLRVPCSCSLLYSASFVRFTGRVSLLSPITPVKLGCCWSPDHVPCWGSWPLC